MTSNMNLYIITGTTKGLGAALHSQLIADNSNVVLSLSRTKYEDVSAPNPTIYTDFANIASVESASEKVEIWLAGKHFERAVLINNAGVVLPVGGINAIGSAELTNNITVNLIAPMVAMRRFAELTRGIAKQRLIINISSGAAKRAIAGWSAYCAAKAGLEMATQVAALEAAAADPTLAICALAPGVVDTPMQGQVRAASVESFPDVERFRTMKADGTLRPAADVARDIVQLIASGKLTNGGIFDIRNMS